MKNRLLLVICALVMASCSKQSGPASITTTSDAYTNNQDALSVLEKYVTFKRKYDELYFSIDYKNGSGGMVPSPTEWDIKIIAKVPENEIDLWIEGAETTSPNSQWAKLVYTELKDKNNMTWYESEGKLLGVNKEQRLIVYYSWAH